MADEENIPPDPFTTPSLTLDDGTLVVIRADPAGLEVRYRTAMGAEGSSFLPKPVTAAVLAAGPQITAAMEPAPTPEG